MSQFNKLYQSAQLRQDMRINPRLYQAMELLYMPLLDLEAHLKGEMEENPFLEMEEGEVEREVELKEDTKDEPLGDDVDWEEILLDGFDVGGRRQEFEQREYFEPTPVDTHDLHDHLTDQLRLMSLSEREIRLGEELIGRERVARRSPSAGDRTRSGHPRREGEGRGARRHRRGISRLLSGRG